MTSAYYCRVPRGPTSDAHDLAAERPEKLAELQTSVRHNTFEVLPENPGYADLTGLPATSQVTGTPKKGTVQAQERALRLRRRSRPRALADFECLLG